MRKKTQKNSILHFAKTKQNGQCVELLLTDKEIEAGKKRATDSKNLNWIIGSERCNIVPTPKIKVEIPVQLSIWERFQKAIGF